MFTACLRVAARIDGCTTIFAAGGRTSSFSVVNGAEPFFSRARAFETCVVSSPSDALGDALGVIEPSELPRPPAEPASSTASTEPRRSAVSVSAFFSPLSRGVGDRAFAIAAPAPPPTPARGNSTVKKKRVPTSSTLTKSISPPMHSTMDLVMTKPKPVPFSFAARCSAGWQNGTNNACCFAAGIPTPLSRTSKVTRELRGVKACAKSAKSALSSSSLHALPPRFAFAEEKEELESSDVSASRATSVTVTTSSTSASRPTTPVLYFTALSTKFTQHCRKRKKSPTNAVLKCSGVARVTTISGRFSLRAFFAFAAVRTDVSDVSV
mmetsp:Transcript_13954/g.59728  ORF Transcript_13954/g.59728 Transcript_13954/m.59728 type:complete len:324 (+) Transcript_13954:728-1699(+)